MTMPAPRPFTIDVPQARLDEIHARVARFAWEDLPDAGGWGAGIAIADLRALVDHWLTRYDWRAAEARLNRLPQFMVDPGGQEIHFVHARGDGSRPPILLIHGWPGSFVEFAATIAPLVADGHDVIVPSLPGYAFSGRPQHPIGPRATAGLFHRLMTGVLGHASYLVQGGDWGAAIGGWIAHDHHASVIGLHLNMVLLQAEDAVPETKDELAWAARRARLAEQEAGYSHLQGTRPQTLGFAMSDSPVGVAAWIAEKFAAWSDVPQVDGAPDWRAAFDPDLLLTNIMLYIAPRSFVTSTWMYRGRMTENSGKFPVGTRIRVPVAVAAFPDPTFPPPPRSQVEKSYDVMRWTDMPAGGHFAALEQPDLWLADVRAFRDALAGGAKD